MPTRDPLTIERLDGASDQTRILRITGPLTLANLFDFQGVLRSETPPLTILDLTGVPYMDSAGMGAVIAYYVSSQNRGGKLLAVGVNYRVLELFKLTHMDGLIPTFASVEEAEAVK
jgi:anti-sigma B factor antagonist